LVGERTRIVRIKARPEEAEARPLMHVAIVLLILIVTYIGMAAGRIAWLQVDRTGITLLAVIALLASGEMTLNDFGSAVVLDRKSAWSAARFTLRSPQTCYTKPINGSG
jgi:hypothetical protein